MYRVSNPKPCLRAALILSRRRCGSGIYFPAKKMAERGFLCRGLFTRTFQANMEYGPLNCTKSFVAHRICLRVRQLMYHLLFPCMLQISLIRRGWILTAVGQFLPDLLFHCWISLRPETRSLRPQYWHVYLRDPSLRLCPFDLYSIHPINGKSTSRVSFTQFPIHPRVLWLTFFLLEPRRCTCPVSSYTR